MAGAGAGEAAAAAAAAAEAAYREAAMDEEPAAAAAAARPAASASMRARQRKARVLLILTCFPHAVPFATRAALFHSLKREAPYAPGAPAVAIRIRRAHLVRDAFRAFERIAHRAPGDLLGRIRVTFVGADVRDCAPRARARKGRWQPSHALFAHPIPPLSPALFPSAGSGGGGHRRRRALQGVHRQRRQAGL